MDFGSGPDMAVMSSPLVDGLVAFDKSLLAPKLFDVKVKEFAAKVDAFSAKVDAFSAQADAYSHATDALRYAVLNAGVDALAGELAHMKAPPPTPPGLTPEQHAAHLAIHDLLSVEEFEEERCRPGFIQLNEHWGANGKQRFCCEKPTKVVLGHKGHVDADFFYKSVVLNGAWMAKIEGSNDGVTWTPIEPGEFLVVPPKEKRPWWDRFLTWVADKVFSW